MSDIRNRPVSITHLVFGLIFLGAAGIWVVGAATDADAPDLAVLAPAVLVGAGLIGLIGMVINARNARVHDRRSAEDAHTQHSEHDDTAVLDHEEMS